MNQGTVDNGIILQENAYNMSTKAESNLLLLRLVSRKYMIMSRGLL